MDTRASFVGQNKSQKQLFAAKMRTENSCYQQSLLEEWATIKSFFSSHAVVKTSAGIWHLDNRITYKVHDSLEWYISRVFLNNWHTSSQRKMLCGFPVLIAGMLACKNVVDLFVISTFWITV